MKVLLSAFLCCLAVNAFASSADSGRCPWKIPFTIKIHAIGSVHKYEQYIYPRNNHDTDYGTRDTTLDFVSTVDTSTTYLFFHELQYSLIADTLRFLFYHDFNPPRRSTSLLIAFAPGKDSISSLIYQQNDSLAGAGYDVYWQYSFHVFSLLFDDTSIFSIDSSYLGHSISMTDRSTDLMTNGSDLFDYNYSDFTATSVDLSGIFRPTHFADQASVAAAPRTEPLAIASLNGSLRCSFGASPEERLLEIFSPLGIKAASCSIPAGQTEAFIPHIPSGFYFVRLGSSFSKVFVAE